MDKVEERLNNNIKGKEIVDTLEKNLNNNSNVFIISHKRPDYDSLGSAAGVFSIVKQMGHKAYILIEEEIDNLDNDIKKIIDDYRHILNITSLKEYELLKNKNNILIMVDVNKKNRIIDSEILEDFKKIIIIDHHDIKEGETVEKSIKLIYPSASSTSELVAQAFLNKKEKEEINKYIISKDLATLLYAGIELDTDRFKSKTTNITHAVANKLLEHGEDKEYINNLFRNDRVTYNIIANMIIKETVIRQYTKDFKELGIAYTRNKELKDYIYTPEELAKAADLQVEFKDTDAVFTIGFIKPNLVAISARSSSHAIDVGRILENLEGGGNSTSAGTQIKTENIAQVEEKLIKVVEEFLSLQETPVIDLEPDLTKKKQDFKKIDKK